MERLSTTINGIGNRSVVFYTLKNNFMLSTQHIKFFVVFTYMLYCTYKHVLYFYLLLLLSNNQIKTNCFYAKIVIISFKLTFSTIIMLYNDFVMNTKFKKNFTT